MRSQDAVAYDASESKPSRVEANRCGLADRPSAAHATATWVSFAMSIPITSVSGLRGGHGRVLLMRCSSVPVERAAVVQPPATAGTEEFHRRRGRRGT